MQNSLEQLKTLLSKDERLLGDGQLLKNKAVELAIKLDPELIALLLSDKQIKALFFTEVEKTTIFDKDKFISFVSNKEFLPDSYTAYKNRVGLNIDGDEFLIDSKGVVLSWPYKDAVLEGGQTQEDMKREEIFWNQTLAPDEISRLLEPKVLTNAKRIIKEGETRPIKFQLDDTATPRENLLIKSNNLLALHSLAMRFTGKIKLIYIDPPYNIGGDSFGYNDKFNHSSWLTFMKNRLEAARNLLSEDGAIFVQIDHHEVAYLGVLMDEIFGRENKIQQISVKTASPAGFKTVNPGPIDVTEYILFYTKSRKNFNFKRGYTPVDYDENYNLYIENIEDEPSLWRLRPLRDVVYELNGITLGETAQQSNRNAQSKLGKFWKELRYHMMGEFALENANRVVSVRDPHKPSVSLRQALAQSAEAKDKVLVYRKPSSRDADDFGEESIAEAYLYNGGALSFYSNKLQNINGKPTPTILLTDFWSDLEWSGIAREGGVRLKNGKKPEALLKRIIELTCDRETDIVLDFFLGSGTTAAVAHKLGYQYIGIEQLDYGENDSVTRLKNVIHGDQSGISKSVNWKGGGDFIYLELAKWNELLAEKIRGASTATELQEMWKEIKEKGRLSHKVDLASIDKSAKAFSELSLANQKRFFLEILDQNHLYINYSDIEDEEYGVSDYDKEISKDFYSD
ncbi:MAG: site-specific DNA-methyltransferase [Anaerolineales bacterium]|nr:site-specific DNA-methyltransferase [Anaerolineales bacterium]